MKKDNILYLNAIAETLKVNEVLSPLPEAEMLVRHYSKIDRVALYSGLKAVPAKAKRSIEKALEIRLTGKPLQYILGETEFCGHRFLVGPDALIPRPETELLVEEALGILSNQYPSQGPQILDVGTGSGCIAVSLTLARPDSRMTALDISQKALAIARKNSQLNGLGKKVSFIKSDLFAAFSADTAENAWDIIVSNPPYIPQGEMADLPREVREEPKLALDGGREGLDIIGRILAQAPLFLKKNGWLLMEIGLGQSGLLADKIAGDPAYKNLKFVQDHAGIDRFLTVQKNG